jgi:hypothetical protein
MIGTVDPLHVVYAPAFEETQLGPNKNGGRPC